MKATIQNLRISEACGWTKCRLAITGSGAPERDESPVGYPPGKNYECSVPGYTYNLNDCRKMRKMLNKEQQEIFVHCLLGIIVTPAEVERGPLNLTQADILWMLCDATAPQQAESFLRTLNLWIDEEE
jgi:hypothetical protein